MEIVHIQIITLVLLQYAILIVLLIKAPKLVGESSACGPVLWIPIVGPMIVLMVAAVIAIFMAALWAPVLFANRIIAVINIFLPVEKKQKYF